MERKTLIIGNNESVGFLLGKGLNGTEGRSQNYHYRRHFMIKRKGLCLIGIAAALMLSACSTKNENNQEFVSHGENVSNGDVSLIVDSDEGKKAALTRPPEEARVKLTIGVVKNDAAAITLANLAAENEEDAAFEKYEFVYAENYTALAQQLKEGKLGVAVMPPAKALDMYAADKSVKVLASLTNKSYRIVGEGISSLSDLAGKTVYMSNDDKTSLCLMTKLVNYAGIKDCKFEYTADNAELYSAVEGGSAECAIMSEPYISMLKQKGVTVKEYDFSQDWENATEGNSYCGGCLVATNEFMTKQKAAVDYMLDDIKRSCEAVKSDAGTSAADAQKYGFIDDAKAAEAAYTAMDIGFFKDRQMRYLINNMFTAFDNADSEVLGTNIPDEDFYLVKD